MNNLNIKYLYITAISSLILKLLIVFFLSKESLNNEWLQLFENFEQSKTFSYYNFGDFNVPTSYMPPLYFFFIIFCKYISFGIVNFIYVIFFFQILMLTISIFVFFSFCKKFFNNEKICLIGTLIFSFFPLLVYSSATISSSTIQIFLYLLFFNLFLDIIDGKNNKILALSFVASLCLLLRGEFIFVFFFSLIFINIIKKKFFLKSLLILFFSFLIISPYLIRNYINTGHIHIVNVTGYALWKGNNHLSKVEGYWDILHPLTRNDWAENESFTNLFAKLDELKKDKSYEIERDKIFLKEGVKNILEDKKKYFYLYIKKILSFYFFDVNSSYKDYYNIFHIFPIIFISFFSIPGLINFYFEKKRDYKLYYIIFILLIFLTIISVFSILPRYKISIINFQILFFLFFLKTKFKNYF